MKKELKNVKLTDEQSATIKQMILIELETAFPTAIIPAEFTEAALRIADNIVKNTQIALIQGAVYEKAVINFMPTKKAKKLVKIKGLKKATKEIKKLNYKITLPKNFGKMTKKHVRK